MNHHKCAAGAKLLGKYPCPECGAGPDQECPIARANEAERLKRHIEFAAWLEGWVSRPMDELSIAMLAGFFELVREKLDKLKNSPAPLTSAECEKNT